MLRAKYSDKVSWLGKVKKENVTATYQGKCFCICKKCPFATRKNKKFHKGNFIGQTEAKNIENFKTKHEDHNWTLIHISRTAKYIQKKMIGGKICQVIL